VIMGDYHWPIPLLPYFSYSTGVSSPVGVD
jgi:hypothetical protein